MDKTEDITVTMEAPPYPGYNLNLLFFKPFILVIMQNVSPKQSPLFLLLIIIYPIDLPWLGIFGALNCYSDWNYNRTWYE